MARNYLALQLFIVVTYLLTAVMYEVTNRDVPTGQHFVAGAVPTIFG
jgi:hypothetical protein